CNYYGFSAMFFGTFSMCIHASVSIIRYVNICHPEKPSLPPSLPCVTSILNLPFFLFPSLTVEWLQLKYVYLLISCSFLYSVGWALGPLFHWGRYETFEFGCTLAFSDPTLSGRSFVTCAFVFVLLLPLVIVVTCYSLIVIRARDYQREMTRITTKPHYISSRGKGGRGEEAGGGVAPVKPTTTKGGGMGGGGVGRVVVGGEGGVGESVGEGVGGVVGKGVGAVVGEGVGGGLGGGDTEGGMGGDVGRDVGGGVKKDMMEGITEGGVGGDREGGVGGDREGGVGGDKEGGVGGGVVVDGPLLAKVVSVKRTQRSLKLHNKLIRMSMVLAGGYVLAWLPYAVVCMWASYGDSTTIPVALRIGASLICKSATAYNPFIYYFMSEGFRADLRWLGRRAGIGAASPLSHPPAVASSSTYWVHSGASSTRSSVRRRERTRENSLQSYKDSYCTNYNQETPHTSLSILTSPDTFHLTSDNPISISTSKSVCLRMSTSSLHRHTAATHTGKPPHQGSIKKRVVDSSVQTSQCVPPSDNNFMVRYDPRNRRMTNTDCGIKPIHYKCRRSVSFILSVEESRQVAKSEDQINPTTKTHRSRSLYGFQDYRRPKISQRDKLFRNTVCMNTRV
ncbi:hypothetical protein Pmani_033145, partial [Petrolisthes manimaculis]